MPIVKVYGVPNSIDENVLEIFVAGVRNVLPLVTQLGITSENVTVFLVPDMLQKGLGEEVCVEVVGLFDKPERSDAVRQRVAIHLAYTVHTHLASHLPQLELIEVLVPKFDQAESGFGRWHKADGFSREKDDGFPR
ncbi:hypothetical protein HN358_04750 [Candidatus Uhrbacteria bacterium]|nr:hypothetical protein [Candidatus Uhrbacteria bacterium]MBT7717092.1 hypothetical protein [Candidatus Uhrbacteria bacterium]